MGGPIGQQSDDAFFGKQLNAVLKDTIHFEWIIHHQSMHDPYLVVAANSGFAALCSTVGRRTGFVQTPDGMMGTDQTCFTLRPDTIGARNGIAPGFEAIHRAFEV